MDNKDQLHRLFPIERWLEDPVSDPFLGEAVGKARIELAGCTDEEVHDLWIEIENILHQYASKHGYRSASFGTGHSAMTQWLSPDSSHQNLPIDNVGLILQHLFPHNYAPLVQLARDISSKLYFGECKILATLILHEAACGNVEGALEASGALQSMYAHIRPLAEDGYNVKEWRPRGGKSKALKTDKEVEERQQQISLIEKKLRADGASKGEITKIIAKRLGISPSTVRRYRKKSHKNPSRSV